MKIKYKNEIYDFVKKTVENGKLYIWIRDKNYIVKKIPFNKITMEEINER